MGVWIETSTRRKSPISFERSHPTWVCGLKHSQSDDPNRVVVVTPYVGVWIETSPQASIPSTPASHPTWVCGLKHVDLSGIDSALASHPTWVCGLKQS